LQVEYYNKIIYPLQDKTIPAFKDSPFYLTGGTALSRGYYNHRYSDDLDYFVNFHPEFKRLAQIQVDKLLTVFNHKVEVDLAVADVVEAIASHRPYRPSRGIDKALEEYREEQGDTV
jgi:predicted nucleotidyltransferase component of viral defense system